METPQNQGILRAGGGVGAYTHFPGEQTESETEKLGVKVYVSQESQAFFVTSSSLCLQLKAAELHSMHTLKSKSETQGNLGSQQKTALPPIVSDWLPASELTVIRTQRTKLGSVAQILYSASPCSPENKRQYLYTEKQRQALPWPPLAEASEVMI